MSRSPLTFAGRVVVALATALAGTACSDDDEAVTLRLLAYSSFPTADTPLNVALDEFEQRTGYTVEIVSAGDTGTMVTKAVLTAGNPEGDVMWGVDNTFLSAANDADVFADEPTLVNTGDVCVNYDIGWFEQRDLAPPTTLEDLRQPQYAELLVVQNPATSSPGFAFLLATVAAYGEDGWQQYWRDLRANGVEVVDSWDIAYYERFSGYAGGSAGGDRPLVVSYGSSPPAEVIFADPPRTDAATGVLPQTCVRGREYAGVLRGTEQPNAAAELVEFLASEPFQRELPLSLFVYPANDAVELPAEFVEYTVIPTNPLQVDDDTVRANRIAWQDEWTQIVLR
jgi:thiamine transport system substrate-binding protein